MKKTALTVQENTKPSAITAETLIAQAIDKKIPVETMEKLLAMRRELKAEWAKEQFFKAMANFQKDCPTIKKTKEIKTNTGVVAYRYAPIESIVSQVKELLQKNGFSYSTTMAVLPAGVKVTVRVTHVEGHSEFTEMEVPLGNKTNIMSASQQTAAASTFAKRYAFCNAFGILTGDEDNDAKDVKEEPKNVALAKTVYASDAQLKLIKDLLKQKGYTEKQVMIKFKLIAFEDLSVDQARIMIDGLLKQPTKSGFEQDMAEQNQEPIVDPDQAEKEIEEMNKAKEEAENENRGIAEANFPDDK